MIKDAEEQVEYQALAEYYMSEGEYHWEEIDMGCDTFEECLGIIDDHAAMDTGATLYMVEKRATTVMYLGEG